MSFPAKYNGVCGNDCGHRIHEGDLVEYVEHVLVHVDCAPAQEPEPRPICPTCFLEIAVNGACECES